MFPYLSINRFSSNCNSWYNIKVMLFASQRKKLHRYIIFARIHWNGKCSQQISIKIYVNDLKISIVYLVEIRFCCLVVTKMQITRMLARSNAQPIKIFKCNIITFDFCIDAILRKQPICNSVCMARMVNYLITTGIKSQFIPVCMTSFDKNHK